MVVLISIQATEVVEIDLIHKGIKTRFIQLAFPSTVREVEIDLIHKGIKTSSTVRLILLVAFVEIDLIHKGIKTPW